MKYFDIECPLIYNPELLGGQRGDGRGWWIVAEAEESLGKYLRRLYRMSTYSVSLLMRPTWHDHITIVRNEFPPIASNPIATAIFWEKWRRQTVVCRVIMEPETNGTFWWLPVQSEAINVLRRELGLAPPEYPLHLTFGNNKHENVE